MFTQARQFQSVCSLALLVFVLSGTRNLSAATDEAIAIAIDSSENIYVTGSAEGFGTRRNFVTIKYDATGKVQWTARFDGPVSGDDIPSAIAVDSWGNVFVTGSSAGGVSGLDFVTIKYNANGVQQWLARFNGPANRDDVPYALAVDTSDNVYVTGSSQSDDRDFVTIKYNANGTPAWTTRWSSGNGDDIARAIQLDGSGNVYITGSATGFGSGLDYLTIKYNSTGGVVWLARYNGPGNGDDIPTAIALDSMNDVYVTGSSNGWGSGLDYATIKYKPNGVQKWVSRYNGPGNYNDRPAALSVDSSCNVYVTGSSFGWGGTVFDYATIKYNKKGATLWTARYDGPASGDDTASALVLDSSGNVYVTGSSLGLGSVSDYATIKYNSNGSTQWISRFDGGAADMAVALAVHGMSHNVYVTGSSFGFGTGWDFATVKYDGNGKFIWLNPFDGP